MADRKATTPEDTTPECPPCTCTDMEREYGHNHSCVYGPLRFLPITYRVGSTRLVVIRAMNTNRTRDHVLQAVWS